MEAGTRVEVDISQFLQWSVVKAILCNGKDGIDPPAYHSTVGSVSVKGKSPFILFF